MLLLAAKALRYCCCVWQIYFVDFYKYDSPLLERAIDYSTANNKHAHYSPLLKFLLDAYYFNRNNSNAVPAKKPEK